MSDSEEPIDPFFGSGDDLRSFFQKTQANKERNVYSPSHKRKHSDSDVEAGLHSPFQERGDLDLLSLPDEVLLHIFSFLGAPYLCPLAFVNKRIGRLSADNLLWKEVALRFHYTNDAELPFWAKSWKDLWHWYYMIKKVCFKEDDTKKSGYGYCTQSNGIIYEGHWKNNLEDDFGIKRWPDDARYEGYWFQGKFHGFGLHVWSTGSFYKGHWENHKRNGKGFNKWNVGDEYEGDWKDDMKNGFGVYKWRDGRVYEGLWKEDSRHGKGCFKIGAKVIYFGEWENDQWDGHGTFLWTDGDYYEGEWKQGRRFGIGVITTTNGEKFVQEWREEVFDELNKGL